MIRQGGKGGRGALVGDVEGRERGTQWSLIHRVEVVGCFFFSSWIILVGCYPALTHGDTCSVHCACDTHCIFTLSTSCVSTLLPSCSWQLPFPPPFSHNPPFHTALPFNTTPPPFHTRLPQGAYLQDGAAAIGLTSYPNEPGGRGRQLLPCRALVATQPTLCCCCCWVFHGWDRNRRYWWCCWWSNGCGHVPSYCWWRRDGHPTCCRSCGRP